MKRRQFVATAASLSSLAIPVVARGQVTPCPPGTVSVSGGSSATTTCAPPPAAAGLPQYMGGMAPFEVRNLAGVYAPSNGMTTMWDTLPAEWKVTGQPNGADAVFGAWSGGSGDAASSKLYFRGGGHGDSSNNGLYCYTFGSGSHPVGFSILPNSLSARSAVVSSNTVYTDNKPTSVHSYDCGRYDPVLNRYYQISGSYYATGNKAASFYYDFATQRWNSDPGGTVFGNSSNLGQFSGTVFSKGDGTKFCLLAGDTKLCFFTSSGVTTVVGTANMINSDEGGLTSTYDSANNRWLTVSYDQGESLVYTHVIDWANNTVTTTRRTHASHATYFTSSSEGASIIYDALLQCYWLFGMVRHCNQSPMTPQILRMDANTFAVSANALTGDSIAVSLTAGQQGSYNRHIWFPAWRIVGTVQSHGAPVSLIKLPA